ncbi:hypothetical protein TNCV_674831 [Trichonephila clavipes]|nr:hypothetical protein TNCV_674831 [Trichonephila clavipes]
MGRCMSPTSCVVVPDLLILNELFQTSKTGRNCCCAPYLREAETASAEFRCGVSRRSILLIHITLCQIAGKERFIPGVQRPPLNFDLIFSVKNARIKSTPYFICVIFIDAGQMLELLLESLSDEDNMIELMKVYENKKDNNDEVEGEVHTLPQHFLTHDPDIQRALKY